MTSRTSSAMFSSLFALLALCLMPANQAHAKPIESIEQVINAAPASSLRKLGRKDTIAAGQAELGKYFGAHVINQPAVIRTRIEFSEPTPQGRQKYRIRAASTPVNAKGVTLKRLNWFYFPQANVPDGRAVPVGAEVTVSGIVRRCEVVTAGGALQINFDLTESKLVRSSAR